MKAAGEQNEGLEVDEPMAREQGGKAQAASEPSFYCTSFCNQAHRLRDGKPIDHECYVINPKALAAERAGDVELACQLMGGKRIRHRGLKRG